MCPTGRGVVSFGEELVLLVDSMPALNALTYDLGRTTASLVAEGFYGIEFRGLHGGEPAADDADDDENHGG